MKDYKESYRLLCDGLVISELHSKFGKEFAIRNLEYFMNHLLDAFNNPETFEFVGAGMKMNSEQYIKFHSERLGMPMSTNLEIVGPGADYPLAPNSSNIY